MDSSYIMFLLASGWVLLCWPADRFSLPLSPAHNFDSQFLKWTVLVVPMAHEHKYFLTIYALVTSACSEIICPPGYRTYKDWETPAQTSTAIPWHALDWALTPVPWQEVNTAPLTPDWRVGPPQETVVSRAQENIIVHLENRTWKQYWNLYL